MRRTMRSRFSVSLGALGAAVAARGLLAVGMVVAGFRSSVVGMLSKFSVFGCQFPVLAGEGHSKSHRLGAGRPATSRQLPAIYAFLTVRRSIRFSNNSPWKIRFTYTLGVCTRSG